MRLRVLYMGTPEFSVPTLDMLKNHHQVKLIGAISMPSRESGRGKEVKDPEVIQFCKNNKIKFWQTENINKDAELLEELGHLKIDLIIVLAFAQFLGKRVLDLPRIGPFNIHTSLLPKYRGAAPIQYALLNGDKETGVSIQRMVKEMDAGDIVLSHPVTISSNETGGELYTKLKFQAALSCQKFINLAFDNKLIFSPQDKEHISFAPTLKKEDGFLDFKNKNDHQILNQVRALKPWPGTYCFLGDKTLKVLEISSVEQTLRPGELKSDGARIIIGTQSQAVSLERIQLPGKKPIATQDFLNGHKAEIIINP